MTADRVQQAREEIRRRRALAEAATPGPWEVRAGQSPEFDLVVVDERGTWGLAEGFYYADATFIAANDPAHVLKGLKKDEKVLDRHAPVTVQTGSKTHGGPAEFSQRCRYCVGSLGWSYPCPDALAVLDLYAPEVTP